MIDLENDIFTYVADRLRATHEGISVYGEYVDNLRSLPAVTIVEADNRVFARMRTLKIENAVEVMYEANVYSNKANGRKTEAKDIADTMDEAFESAGFTRTFRSQTPNLNDSTIYRITCRYEAVIGRKDENNYLIYQS